jgi:multiple sugar transport system permease protein
MDEALVMKKKSSCSRPARCSRGWCSSSRVLSALVPVLWTFINSFKNRVDIVSAVPKFFFTPTLENYAYVLGREAVAQGLVNSILVVGAAVAIGAVLGLPAAYALARYPLRWADDIQFFVLSMRFLPPVAVAIPLMVIWLQLELYDTRFALIVTYTLLTLSTVIWLAIPAFKAVPKEVEEAGASTATGPTRSSFACRCRLPRARWSAPSPSASCWCGTSSSSR